ncbi:MAG: S8 family peptidase [Bacteroidales bacterium]|nr:S8 family peptidase [Bacteroidales bacterium]
MKIRHVFILFLSAALISAANYSYSDNGDGLKNKNRKKKSEENKSWHTLDPKKDKVAGISLDKAYREILKNKTPHKVIVAVIDGGADIEHEDIKNRIWTNKKEIPGNNIDDDNNGFIDDIHGWNFIGNARGENIKQETMELTRLFRDMTRKFGDTILNRIKIKDTTGFAYYKKISREYHAKYKQAASDYDLLKNSSLNKYFVKEDSIMMDYLKKTDYSIMDLLSVDTKDSVVNESKYYLLTLIIRNFDIQKYKESMEYYFNQYLFGVDTSFNPRKIIGDDPTKLDGVHYGNNDVIAVTPSHGTFVSGIIAAERNNNVGMDGIADSVEIMVIRAIPDGDERDKDVANAIRYAINNGAKIINMSFGKGYSPEKIFVDDVLKLAEEKDVLLIHAAGNDGENNDVVENYPKKYFNDGKIITENWIEVGASTKNLDKNLAASFSNYGKKNVDIFAPGESVYSLKPGNNYTISDGTSFACPMVAGVAALLKSYYPQMTAKQIKKVILESSLKFEKKKVYKPDLKSEKKIKVKFGALSVTGGLLNAYNAVNMAEKDYSKK